MLALVDANLNFIYIDVGTNGRVSDGGIFAKSNIYKALTNNCLNMPLAADLPNTECSLPFKIIADNAFPLSGRIVKPYPQRGLTKERRVFNYRICRARRIVENAFGVLNSRFGIFNIAIATSVPDINDIVIACTSLHNMLNKLDKRVYSPPGFIDDESTVDTTVRLGEWRRDGHNMQNLACQAHRPPRSAMEQRDTCVTS